ncbi:MAG: signal peptidase, endoplasmic reticulum-type [Parcubacteria group bacterium Gr01-1014_106]|nr:MAG: signal peptidase, endoplasmic reticulum-type [Parcubacteria group bacterium Gr01-1014_106]
MMKTAAKFLLNAVIYVAIVVGILWGVPRFLSWKLKTPYPIAAITSGSMWPVLKSGDLILIRGVVPGAVAKGDVIVWQQDRGFTIHRVVAVGEKTVTTKGDANFTEDSPVPHAAIIGKAVDVRGKLFRIPFLGVISTFGARLRGGDASSP